MSVKWGEGGKLGEKRRQYKKGGQHWGRIQRMRCEVVKGPLSKWVRIT